MMAMLQLTDAYQRIQPMSLSAGLGHLDFRDLIKKR
ncbi:hypothetical protein MY3296_000612 [Beauveria thailandica]